MVDDINQSKILYDPPPRVREIKAKISKWDLIKHKIFCKAKWKWSRVWLFVTPWAVAYQVPLSMGLSRQEYWSGLTFPSPGHLPDPGIEPGSPTLQADTLSYTKAFVWFITNWKILKEMGISDHLTCLLRNLYAGQEATVPIQYCKVISLQLK